MKILTRLRSLLLIGWYDKKFHNNVELQIQSISLPLPCLDGRRHKASQRGINQSSQMAGGVWLFSLCSTSSPAVCWWDVQHASVCENCEADAGLTWPAELNRKSLLGRSEISKVWGWETQWWRFQPRADSCDVLRASKWPYLQGMNRLEWSGLGDQAWVIRLEWTGLKDQVWMIRFEWSGVNDQAWTIRLQCSDLNYQAWMIRLEYSGLNDQAWMTFVWVVWGGKCFPQLTGVSNCRCVGKAEKSGCGSVCMY